MIMRDENKQALADKIARLLQNDAGVEGSEQVWRALDDLARRVEALERTATIAVRSATAQLPHPSLEKYKVIEAFAPEGAEEKACAFEPNGRTCDHCSMCSSRGF